MKSNLEGFDLPRFAELDAEYEILRELGRGGTAVVYLARERELGRRVAIKVIRATYIEDEDAAARLVREARTVASLQHPNIVMLHGTRRLLDNSLALIMQYVPGRTLKSEVLATGPLPFDRIQQILTDVGRALACAQRHRIVHRDIKPENVYLDEWTGIARLSDFGIARPWDAEQGLTLPGMAIGTPAYMSPEQIDGGVLDGRSDLYSLGLVGYEMLTGQAPWAGEGLFSMIYKQKHESLPPLDVLRPGIPFMLRRALEGALHKNREDRWLGAQEFLEALTGKLEAPPPVVVAESESAPQVATPSSNQPTIQYRRPEVTPVTVPAPPLRAEVIPARPVEPVLYEDEPPQLFHQEEDADAYELDEFTELDGFEPSTDRPNRRRALLVTVVPAILLGLVLMVLVKQGGGDDTLPSGLTSSARAQSPPLPTGNTQSNDTQSNDTQTKAATDLVPALAWKRSGDRQEGVAGDTLAKPLLLQVEDASGRPVPGVPVQFAVTAGQGAVVPRNAVTDASGIAEARWLLRQSGPHTLSATVAQLNGRTVEFSARAESRPPANITQVSPTELKGAAGTALASPLVVRVTDDRGDPVNGAAVTFSVRSGQGQISPGEALTGRDGTVRVEWVLGQGAAQEAVATLPDLPSARAVFRATVAQPELPVVRRAVAVGGTHTCALSADGDADCWGANDKGQLGDGSASRRNGTVRVAAPEPLASLSAGGSHTCGVSVTGKVLCWGTNSAGQLGDGTRGDRAQPARLATEAQITRVFAGMSHTCGLDAAGRLYCWGQNTHGQLGDGTRTDRPAPVSISGSRTFRTVSLGWAHTCALATDGAAYCWGRNTSGELGDGSTIGRPEPAPVDGGARFAAIAAGNAHTCGLTTTGSVLCWGSNAYGQLGNNTTEDSTAPVVVQPTDFFSAIALGSNHTCALTRDGSARCWGRNTYGQLGDGSVENRLWPTPVTGGLRFSTVNASGAHTCGTTAGTTYCWGFNSEGQLGNGTRTNQTRPVVVNRQ